MIKLLQFFIKNKGSWSDLQYCHQTSKNRSLNVFIRHSIYSLVILVSVWSIFTIIERQQIEKQLKTQIRIAQYEKEIEDSKQVIFAESIRMVSIDKISGIIKMHNYNLDEFGHHAEIQAQVVFQSNIQDSTVIQVVYLDTLSQRTYGRRDLANEIYEMTLKYDNLDIDLISATITHESAGTWSATIVSPAGAMGLMQIMPYTGRDLTEDEGIEWTNKKDILFNPITNIRLGSRYLSNLITKYSDNLNREYAVEAALAAYNGGERRVGFALRRNKDRVELRYLWRETQTYIPRVLGLYNKYTSM